MEWSEELIGRLFELHKQQFEQLRKDVISTNQSLGSQRPEKTWLIPLTRKQFHALLVDPAADSEAMGLWIRRIVRGREREFPELEALRRANQRSPVPGRRATGT
jgi:hypothetical protein